MIITFLIQLILMTIQIIFDFLPTATIQQIPLIGDIVNTSLNTMIGYWNSFEIILPYAIALKEVFLMILTFEIGLLVLKFFLGNRLPAQLN